VFWRLSVVRAYDPGIAALRAARTQEGTTESGGH
jgi:hypothetical protein